MVAVDFQEDGLLRFLSRIYWEFLEELNLY